MMATPDIVVQEQQLVIPPPSDQPPQQQQQMQASQVPTPAPPPYQQTGYTPQAPPPPTAPTATHRAAGRPQKVSDRTDIVPPLPNKVRPANPNHTVIAMVVDRSGSMQSMGCEVSGGCNAYIEEVVKGDIEDATTSSLIFTRFDNVAETLYENVPLATGLSITNEDVKPRGSTALYDAIGSTMQRTVATLESLDSVPKVVFFILTDGKENASRVWKKSMVTKEIKKLQAEPYNWDFYFAAANQDALQEGSSIGMDTDACITYGASSKSMASAFRAQGMAHGRRKKGFRKGYTAEERSMCME